MRKQDAKTISALTLAACLSMSGLAMAQMPGAPGAPGGPGASGPIDITADEQEFSGEAVIARGRVRVVYKDSVIVAPLATLYKDPSGNPNRAIFTGHPRLTQEKNKIDANTLIFEMAQQKIVAEGNAHSEVDVPEDENSADTGLGGNSKTASGNKPFPAPPVNTTANKNNGDDDEDDAPKASANKGTAPAAEPEKKTAKAEKIITDSDRQEYDEATGKFDALGHVKVVHGEITVIADKLQLVYGAVNKKPETALFTGHVQATQGKNTTCADNLNYSLSTKRLQASGNVKSKVIQDKNQNQKDTKKKKNDDAEDPTAKADFFGAPAKASSNKQLNGGTSAVSIASGSAMEDNKPVWVFSDSQDYSKENGRVSAHGNVRVVSGDMYGCGPAIVLTKKPDGRADKVYFQGRSQISQPGRRWIADEITYIVDEKKVIANGNAKAMIIQDKNQKQQPAQNYQLAGKKAPLVSENRNGASTTDKQRISSKEAITK
jgi:lipopolysaccharide export system protein LptA